MVPIHLFHKAILNFRKAHKMNANVLLWGYSANKNANGLALPQPELHHNTQHEIDMSY